MSDADLIDGKMIAQEIRGALKPRIQALKTQNITPGLAVVLIGEDPASQVYVRMKSKAFAKLEMMTETFHLDKTISQTEVLQKIEALNQDDRFHGILVQLPLPDHLDELKIILAVDPRKDADGLHPLNMGKMLIGADSPLPCTPHGIVMMLKHMQIDPAGKHVVVLGRSNIVGKPVANMLLQKKKRANATVTVCHSRTRNIKAIARQADILIAALGQPEMITRDFIKPGATVIDVGVNRVDAPQTEKGYRLAGDVNFKDVSAVAGAISPVPGGVGPMTITMLLYNTVHLAEKYGSGQKS